ncbi:hypothetical protein COV20_05520 [Candidatus Woesearchaeota archaeon CG10_big_fil_rev_8_21_14_0_10_45_16]|nr:MAG: hypothetical protein COV20_05520 [Candidatus Woesearchaeota archaeon CG10_big_fil_rev_8_21_14_0_10_45_16]
MRSATIEDLEARLERGAWKTPAMLMDELTKADLDPSRLNVHLYLAQGYRERRLEREQMGEVEGFPTYAYRLSMKGAQLNLF